MKKLVNVTEVEGEGLEALLGEDVLIMCVNYFYAGKLTGVNATCILLEDPKIVFETGVLTAPGYKDAQALPAKKWYVQRSLIESFGVSE